jgi:hypothetical protein
MPPGPPPERLSSDHPFQHTQRRVFFARARGGTTDPVPAPEPLVVMAPTPLYPGSRFGRITQLARTAGATPPQTEISRVNGARNGDGSLIIVVPAISGNPTHHHKFHPSPSSRRALTKAQTRASRVCLGFPSGFPGPSAGGGGHDALQFLSFHRPTNNRTSLNKKTSATTPARQLVAVGVAYCRRSS